MQLMGMALGARLGMQLFTRLCARACSLEVMLGTGWAGHEVERLASS